MACDLGKISHRRRRRRRRRRRHRRRHRRRRRHRHRFINEIYRLHYFLVITRRTDLFRFHS